jgi:lysophospholipase L1-like esterase
MTVLQVTATMTAALLLWALADAPALLHGAETSPLGARRNAALAVLRPLDRVSAALGIDRLSHVADRLLHRHGGSGTTKAPVALPLAPGPIVVGPTKTPPAAKPAAGLAALRVGTAADPLRVLVIGDSIGLSFGDSLANKLDGTGIVKTTIDAREGTGLTRPDAFDWAAEMRADLAHFRPEVVVAMFGGNDDQDTIINGRFIPFGSQAWTVIYGARVAALADAVHGARAHLLWSGLPVMRSATKSQRLQAVMAVTRAALAHRDGAVFVDNVAALSDASGHYVVAMTSPAGQTVIVREPDGIHLSPAGADRLADGAIGGMQAAWHLDLRPPASPPAANPPAANPAAATQAVASSPGTATSVLLPGGVGPRQP